MFKKSTKQNDEVVNPRYKSKEEFIISLGNEIGKDLNNLFANNEEMEFYEFSKGILENIIYEMTIKDSSSKVIIDYKKINQLMQMSCVKLKFPNNKNILDYCYLALSDEILRSVAGEKINQEVIIEALNYIKEYRN